LVERYCRWPPTAASRSASRTRRASSGTSGRRAPTRARPGSGASRTRTRAQRTRAPRARAPRAASRRERAADALVDRPAARLAGDVRRHEAPATVDEEGLGEPGDSPVAERRADAVANDSVRHRVPLDEALRRAAEVLRVDPDEHHALRFPARGGGRERARLLLARHTPRRPEVDDDHLASVAREVELRASVQSWEPQVRRSHDLSFVNLLRNPSVLVRDVPDEQAEQGEHDGDGGELCEAAHQTMNTVVPMPTWLKSHSASGMCMRMQPCDAL